MAPTSEVWILDTVVDGWENRSMSAELTRRGHDARVVDWSSVVLSGGRDHVIVDGEPCRAPRLALVKGRVLTRRSERDLALIYDGLEALEELGTRFADSLVSTRRSNNKLRQAGILARAGTPIPPTRGVRTREDVEACLVEWDDVVLKPIFGHSSFDLVRIRRGGSRRDPDVLLGAREDIFVWHLLERHGLLIAQPFVPNPGRDIRVTILGTTIASCNFHVATSPDGTVRDFLHPWRMEAAPVTPELEEIAATAMAALGLTFGTIDLVEGPEGPTVIEVNDGLTAFRSFEGTEFDLAPGGHTSLIVDVLESLLDDDHDQPHYAEVSM